MKAIITKKGARRYSLHGMAGRVVEVDNLRTYPKGSQFCRLVTPKWTLPTVHVYTPGHGENCALILLGEQR